jgi:predicted enzyme related to lactoylglutathione lyase
MSVTFFSISLDCADAGKQADFWAQVLNRSVDDGASPEFAAIGLQPGGGEAAGVVWMFHRVPEPKRAKNRVHVDFLAGDLDAEVQRVLTLGATHVRDIDEGGYQWATLTDPEGNEFDIVATPQ